MRDDLEQEVRLAERCLDLAKIGFAMLVAHRTRRNPQGTVVQRADLGSQCRLGKLLRKATELAPARDESLIVEEHAVGVAATATTERDRDDLAAIGAVGKAIRIRHADEFIYDERFARIELQRLGTRWWKRPSIVCGRFC